MAILILQIKFIILQYCNIFAKNSLLKKYFVFFLCVGLYFIGFSQTARNYSNEFLNIGVDAASLGKANAVVASTNNVTSGYWNPAGLIHIKEKQVALMHASYFANIANYDYAAYATKLDDFSALGATIIRFGVDDILDTRALITSDGSLTPFNELPTFSAADYGFIVSYARNPFNKKFVYGVNAKVIRRIIGDFASSWGFGFDAAIQFKSKDEKWNYGIIARDITTTFNAWQIDDDLFENDLSEEDAAALNAQEVPEKTEITIPSLQMGVQRSFELKRDFNLGVEYNMYWYFTQTNDLFAGENVSIAPALGFEFDFKKMVFLRGGVGNFQEVAEFDGNNSIGFQPNFGVGFSYKGITVDYAFTDIGDQSAGLYSNIFSLRIDWSLFRR